MSQAQKNISPQEMAQSYESKTILKETYLLHKSFWSWAWSQFDGSYRFPFNFVPDYFCLFQLVPGCAASFWLFPACSGWLWGVTSFTNEDNLGENLKSIRWEDQNL